MPLLRKVDAVVGQGDVPLSGVSEADAQMLRQRPAESGKGMGIVNELLARYPRAQLYWWWGNQQDFTSIQGDKTVKAKSALTVLSASVLLLGGVKNFRGIRS